MSKVHRSLTFLCRSKCDIADFIAGIRIDIDWAIARFFESNTCITVATSSQLSLLKCAVPIRYTCNPCERGFIARFRDPRIVISFYLGARVWADEECAGGREVRICYLLWEDVFKLGELW